MRAHAGWVMLLGSGCIGAIAAAQSSVVDSPHNLSTSGPGVVRAVTEEQVCIFCHAPHNATPVQPLWNRAIPTQAYSIYNSRSLDAEPGQPTGTSKMCLSCHDGTIALGSVNSRQTPIQMGGGSGTIPSGPGHLGTDLRDDHPVSFRYDSSLATTDRALRDPSTLPPEIRLDVNSELQCTSCHDAHNNAFGDFLVMAHDGTSLCISCHQMGTTTIQGHDTCNACHQSHSAPSGPYLLTHTTVADTCLSCHDGSHPRAANIEDEISRPSNHETDSPVDPPEPLIEHASCHDCHEPHTMTSTPSSVPDVPGNLGQIHGMNSSGAPVEFANFEYEVCFRCHADGNRLRATVSRYLAETNTRLEFDAGAISYHPVQATGRNPDVPSLLPGWTPTSLVACSDCHRSDSGSGTGGFGAKGVHGSSHRPLLARNYEISDFTVESAQAYALCYMCHDRNSILGDESFEEHRKHIVEERTPCAACHDAHGISQNLGTITGNSHLINFATNIVFPDPNTGRIEFVDTGMFSGQCFLRCHSENHSPESYPEHGSNRGAFPLGAPP